MRWRAYRVTGEPPEHGREVKCLLSPPGPPSPPPKGKQVAPTVERATVQSQAALARGQAFASPSRVVRLHPPLRPQLAHT